MFSKIEKMKNNPCPMLKIHFNLAVQERIGKPSEISPSMVVKISTFVIGPRMAEEAEVGLLH